MIARSMDVACGASAMHSGEIMHELNKTEPYPAKGRGAYCRLCDTVVTSGQMVRKYKGVIVHDDCFDINRDRI